MSTGFILFLFVKHPYYIAGLFKGNFRSAQARRSRGRKSPVGPGAKPQLGA